MIKVIANKKIDISKDEYRYYLELKRAFGSEPFIGLFKTDENGKITTIDMSPDKPIAIVLVFFLLNVRFNQALRVVENKLDKISELEVKISKLEEKLNGSSE